MENQLAWHYKSPDPETTAARTPGDRIPGQPPTACTMIAAPLVRILRR